MVYGIITSFILPILFYDKLSLYFLEKRADNEPKENLKDAFFRSFDILGMNQVLKKIYSFENFIWINNQVYLLVELYARQKL